MKGGRGDLLHLFLGQLDGAKIGISRDGEESSLGRNLPVEALWSQGWCGTFLEPGSKRDIDCNNVGCRVLPNARSHYRHHVLALTLAALQHHCLTSSLGELEDRIPQCQSCCSSNLVVGRLEVQGVVELRKERRDRHSWHLDTLDDNIDEEAVLACTSTLARTAVRLEATVAGVALQHTGTLAAATPGLGASLLSARTRAPETFVSLFGLASDTSTESAPVALDAASVDAE